MVGLAGTSSAARRAGGRYFLRSAFARDASAYAASTSGSAAQEVCTCFKHDNLSPERARSVRSKHTFGPTCASGKKRTRINDPGPENPVFRRARPRQGRRKGGYLMTKAQRPAELREAFVTNEEQRLLEDRRHAAGGQIRR
jgi:hypothetical protein